MDVGKEKRKDFMQDSAVIERIKTLFIHYLSSYYNEKDEDKYLIHHALAYEKLLREFTDEETVKHCIKAASEKIKP